MSEKMDQIPGSIVKSICAVMANLEAVKKSQKNQHGGYMFASTDDIYAAITRKMGEVGLVCLCLEEAAPEITRSESKDGKAAQWMKMAYSFVLATADATWSDPRSRRTLIIQITGPQTFQAAQSYAEKSYLRSLFKIPTGDVDLDSLPEDYEYGTIKFKSDMPPPPPPADASLAADGEHLKTMTGQEQIDLEQAIAAKAREDADFISQAVAKFQTAALNATDADELLNMFEGFEQQTDGRLSEEARAMAQTIYDANMGRLAG